MAKMKLALAASVLIGAAALAGPALAAPISPNGLQAAPTGITQVRMTHSERMMMKKRMMRKKMMRRHMMKKRMMNRM
ncbi:hypothetical protein ACLBX9_06000 [Methylobacterium sp. A49B]|uniref:Pentapeptide MXKDX repeat protein n=1 Tax=Methylobacterium mesophilicum SR1.6/6 TaxID=908290 RepID=A0A6B9F8U8_9HYPH|nr:hypothetical protein [Methylobacterium mesophilicum]QGY00570.1 hypothetical protein MMSR116_00550 [Methylobacterium mesophilicum SR1.6/6]